MENAPPRFVNFRTKTARPLKNSLHPIFFDHAPQGNWDRVGVRNSVVADQSRGSRATSKRGSKNTSKRGSKKDDIHSRIFVKTGVKKHLKKGVQNTSKTGGQVLLGWVRGQIFVKNRQNHQNRVKKCQIQGSKVVQEGGFCGKSGVQGRFLGPKQGSGVDF